MTSSVLTNPKERMGSHLVVLRKYADRVLTQGDCLMPWEEADKVSRMEDFFDIGSSFKCTDKELVAIIIRDLMNAR